MTKTYAVREEWAGSRLDHVLAEMLDDTGLRTRRRLCGQGRVLVNGRAAGPAYKVKAEDVIRVEEERDADGFCARPPRLVRETEHLAALDKTAGMHTVSLRGKEDASLESFLPALLPGGELLNRLDFATSGLVLVAKDEAGRLSWERAQAEGLMEKRYLALLQGCLPKERTVSQWLKISGRASDKPSGEKACDPARATLLRPLLCFRPPGTAEEITLAACMIRKGARHQIRAHAAFAGYPLWGDQRYGAQALPDAGDGERFFLHHGHVRWRDFCASCPPPWLDMLPEEGARAALEWFALTD